MQKLSTAAKIASKECQMTANAMLASPLPAIYVCIGKGVAYMSRNILLFNKLPYYELCF